MRYCTKCGTMITENSNFCKKCGAKINRQLSNDVQENSVLGKTSEIIVKKLDRNTTLDNRINSIDNHIEETNEYSETIDKENRETIEMIDEIDIDCLIEIENIASLINQYAYNKHVQNEKLKSKITLELSGQNKLEGDNKCVDEKNTEIKTEMSKKEDDNFWENIFRIIWYFTDEFKQTPPLRTNNAICPDCGSSDTQIIQKNSTTMKNKMYNIFNGGCGLLLMGPFGLLCGLCGKGSTMTAESETWWVCKTCGKQHLSIEDSYLKGQRMIEQATSSIMWIAFVLSFLMYRFGFFGIMENGFFDSLLVFVLFLLASASMWKDVEEEINEAIGVKYVDILTPKQKEDYSYAALGYVITASIGWIGCRILINWLVS